MELKLSLKHLLKVYHGWRGVLMKDGLSCHSIFRFFFSSLIARLLVISPQNLFCISLNFFGVLCFSFFFLCFHFFLFVLQVLINGLQHIVTVNVKPKLQMVETFIKVSTQSIVKVICFAWCHLYNNIWGILVILMIAYCHLSFGFQTGLLPSWNWICALVARPPGKKFHYQ